MTTVRWNGEWFEDITELLADGTVSVTLDTVLPLSEATEAHRLSEAKHARGKIILTPGDDESASN
ncbi:zinc-binding dehydrogenase [Haloarcula marismortui]|nr:zinc-binding dehydrogenase [Haloarcula californiae]EMA11178.1 zinc-binding oxidoreductase [Haloarcula californiae ATCC 33799]